MHNLLKTMITFAMVLVLASPSMANSLRYESPLHQATWKTTSSRLVCRLSHTIDYYGKAEFVRFAGREIYLTLNMDQGGPRNGKARLVALPTAWQHKLENRELGHVSYKGGLDPFRFSRVQVRDILASLEQGLRPALHYHSRQSGADEVEVVLSSINFREGMEEFRRCMANLITVDYAAASDSNILFKKGYLLDPKARQRLDAIASYVQADSVITKVRLEGHSDNVGSRGDNYALSRSRALAVREYLLARNVPPEMIEFEYYGEHNPAYSNRTKKGRQQNRRVNVKLIKPY